MKITRKQLRHLITEALDDALHTESGYMGGTSGATDEPDDIQETESSHELSSLNSVDNTPIYKRADLTDEEISAVETELGDDATGDFYGTSAFEKLYNYYLDEGEMPYTVAKGDSETPDEWILNQLSGHGNTWFDTDTLRDEYDGY